MGKNCINIISKALLGALALCLAGCAFDLSYVKKEPVTFTPGAAAARDFILNEAVSVSLGTGYPTHLKNGTRWHPVGHTEHGPVYTTKDQIVTVEASNIYEARPVIAAEQRLVGFYLPVEQQFVRVRYPVRIKTHPLESTPPPEIP